MTNMRAWTLVGPLFVGAIACAPPAPGETVGGTKSESLGPSSAAKIVFADVVDETAFGPNESIKQTVLFDRPGQGAQVCYAYLDGTEEERHACDDAPRGFEPMLCTDGPELLPDAQEAMTVTGCRTSSSLGRAPFDRDGRYAVHFASAQDPADRHVRELDVDTDVFTLSVDSDHLPSRRNLFVGSNTPIAPGTTTQIAGGLLISILVNADHASQLTGCGGMFSTVGLTEAAVAKIDAEIVASCAAPTVRIEGLEGWKKTGPTAPFHRVSFDYDASPFVGVNQHFILVFAVEERVRVYIFAS